MWEQVTQFIMGERIFLGEMKFVPEFLCGRFAAEGRMKFIPGVRQGSSGGADASGQHIQELETACHLPTSEVTTAGTTPVHAGKTASGPTDPACDFDDRLCRNSTFFFGEFRSEFLVMLDQFFNCGFKR